MNFLLKLQFATYWKFNGMMLMGFMGPSQFSIDSLTEHFVISRLLTKITERTKDSKHVLPLSLLVQELFKIKRCQYRSAPRHTQTTQRTASIHIIAYNISKRNKVGVERDGWVNQKRLETQNTKTKVGRGRKSI